MDEQDRQDAKALHRELTRQIIGCAFEVINGLGSGFLESVYEKAMLIALSDKGISVESQRPIGVRFRGKPVGNFYADLFVEESVIGQSPESIGNIRRYQLPQSEASTSAC